MNFLVWHPRPKRIYIIGLGGGNLELLLHSIFPEAIIETADIDPELPYIAERFFGLTFDDRQRVYVQDGKQYLESQPEDKLYDAIIIDAFSESGNPEPSMQTSEFYELCKKHLTINGVVAVNMVEPEWSLQRNINIFVSSFENSYIYRQSEMCVLFGGRLKNITNGQIVVEASKYQKKYQFTFPFMLRAGVIRKVIKAGDVSKAKVRDVQLTFGLNTGI